MSKLETWTIGDTTFHGNADFTENCVLSRGECECGPDNPLCTTCETSFSVPFSVLNDFAEIMAFTKDLSILKVAKAHKAKNVELASEVDRLKAENEALREALNRTCPNPYHASGPCWCSKFHLDRTGQPIDDQCARDHSQNCDIARAALKPNVTSRLLT